ncbi:hypothetical protein T484DRAFT_1898683, partial [Baffinella frigidus]
MRRGILMALAIALTTPGCRAWVHARGVPTAFVGVVGVPDFSRERGPTDRTTSGARQGVCCKEQGRLRCSAGPGLGSRLGGLAAAALKASPVSATEEEHTSRRARRRKRAPPTDLQQWEGVLDALPGGLCLLLDLDNAADSVPMLEDIRKGAPARRDARGGEDDFCVGVPLQVRGFAGVDYNGPAPAWLPVDRCGVRTKNGADFVLAFHAGRIVDAWLSAHPDAGESAAHPEGEAGGG